jgi:serine protease Do
MPSVVSITSVSKETLYDIFYGYYENESISAGSGIIIGKNDNELLIATNSHVVSGSDNIKIYFSVNSKEEKEIKANIKGTDDTSDLAIISVKLSDLSDEIINNIKIATIGDASELELGEPLIAIGNALGYGQSVTTGVVSALDRKLGDNGPFIQTDAAINPGNSGGALINAKGEVIGINCAKLADTNVEGIGYAIPSSVFVPILKDLSLLETKEKVNEEERGYLGILGTDISEEASKVYGMPKGVFISQLIENGAASKSLLQEKDIIIKLNNIDISTMEQLQNELSYYKAGEKVTITVKRFIIDKYTDVEINIILEKK